MNTEIEALDKANCIIDTLLEDYSILDTQNPTDEDKKKYSMDCGRIHSLISLASDCVRSANRELREADVDE
jgi:hypothetical protein